MEIVPAGRPEGPALRTTKLILLQVCNVGQIVGGTAACAWSITRAFPDVQHHVAFLSRVANGTREAFGTCRLHRIERVTNRFVREIGADAVILHNTAASRVEPRSAVWTLQYVHSRGPRALADRTVFCSRWLAQQCGRMEVSDGDVLYQGVPRPTSNQDLRMDRRGDALVIGRLCTPTTAKWPDELGRFYETLSLRHPVVTWEFVGCPKSLEPRLMEACRGRACFHPAGWSARAHLARWDALLYHHPTLTESFGRTVAEAMRAGCVPVVDDRGGFREQITPSTGRLCGSLEGFCEAVDDLRSIDARGRMSLAADERFSMQALRGRLLAILRGA
jgi:glycosyltransferase involved in cell wall biosynthesis